MLDVTGIETRSIGYDFGLAGMKAWESFYTSGLLSLGIIGQHQHLEGVDNEDRMLTSSTINLLVDFGYRSKNSSVGLQLRTQTFGIPVEDTEFNKSRQGGRIYFNYFL